VKLFESWANGPNFMFIIVIILKNVVKSITCGYRTTEMGNGADGGLKVK